METKSVRIFNIISCRDLLHLWPYLVQNHIIFFARVRKDRDVRFFYKIETGQGITPTPGIGAGIRIGRLLRCPRSQAFQKICRHRRPFPVLRSQFQGVCGMFVFSVGRGVAGCEGEREPVGSSQRPQSELDAHRDEIVALMKTGATAITSQEVPPGILTFLRSHHARAIHLAFPRNIDSEKSRIQTVCFNVESFLGG